MPIASLEKIAKNAKINLTDAEAAWDKAKSIVKTQYKKDEKDISFWPLTMAITKKILGIKKSNFKSFVQSK